jgi:hypothetical protein
MAKILQSCLLLKITNEHTMGTWDLTLAAWEHMHHTMRYKKKLEVFQLLAMIGVLS